MTLSSIIERAEKSFDEQFGKRGPESDSDSIGRKAGCDDCAGSIEIREEHREFLISTLQSAIREAFAATKQIKASDTIFLPMADSMFKSGYDSALKDIEKSQEAFLNHND